NHAMEQGLSGKQKLVALLRIQKIVLMTAEQLASEFEASKGALQSYLLRITASVPDTEDIVQDTYLKAAEKLDTFRGESSVKTWLFAIATNLAKDNLKARKRWTEHVTDIAKTFLHMAFFASEADQQILNELPSFKYFQQELKASKPERMPEVESLTLVGSSGSIF